MPIFSMGLDVLNAAYASGEAIVLTGRMLTWSESTLTDMGGDFLEPDEGIFYHTLKDTDPVPTPFLDLTFIPEPSSACLIAVAALGLLRRNRRQH